MGDIADMHVEAYAAGLDPNEMDGADWADFYDGQDGLRYESDEEAAEAIRQEMASWVMQIALSRGRDGESVHELIQRLFPILTEGQAMSFVSAVDAIGGIPYTD